jgi:hypothetical protein
VAADESTPEMRIHPYSRGAILAAQPTTSSTTRKVASNEVVSANILRFNVFQAVKPVTALTLI